MKTLILSILATVAATSLSFAQVGYWSDAGLIPRTPTIDVNTNDNNNSLETGDISITANTNTVLAWEDDGNGLTDWEAVWTLYDSLANLLVAPVTITNIAGSPCDPNADSVSNVTYRAFFRSNGSPIPGYTADYGGKAKANLFGTGFGFGSAGGDIACEIPELAAIALGQGNSVAEDFPVVQLLNSDGSPNATAGGPDVPGILSFSDADCEPAGNIRIADFEFLSNGNVLIVGESRQATDTNLTGQASGNVVVYKVLSSSGAVVMPYTNGSSEAVPQSMWHGAAAVSNGFALRFGSDAGDRIRFFDNAGHPQGPNVDIAAATCHPEAATGGRGDGAGFKGNGKDAYVFACTSGAAGPWITVFNANGTVRYSRKVADLADNPDASRLDAAIDSDGRVIVIFDASNNDTNNTSVFRLPQARLFDPCGRPIGPVFYVSERETPTNAVAGNGGSGRPRVAFRNNTISAMWGSLNSPAIPGSVVLSLRIFNAPAPGPCSAAPVISLSQSDTNAIISWDASFGFMTLQSTPSLSPPAWTCVSPQPAIVSAGSQNAMTVPIGTGNQLFRLSQ